MGIMAVLKNFTRVFSGDVHHTDATVDPGGQPLKTSEHFSAAGDDSHPLTGDYVAAVSIPRSGGCVAVGYVDPSNAAVTQPGGKRIYSRNENAAPQGQVWLKNNGENLVANSVVSLKQTPDGAQIVTNGAGTYELEAGGDIVINGVRISPGGVITQVTSFKDAAGREYVNHLHNAGTPPGTTGPNL